MRRPGAQAPGGPGWALVTYTRTLIVVDIAFATALAPLLPHYAHAAGLSKTGAGVLMAAFPVGSILGALPGGAIAGRLGSRTAVLLGLLAEGAAALALGWSSTIAIVAAARFVQGVAGSGVWAGGLAWLTGATPQQRRGEEIGAAMGFAAAGTVAGPAIGAFAVWAGPGPAFSVTAGVIWALMAAGFLLPDPQDVAPRQDCRQGALRDRAVWAGVALMLLGGLAIGTFDVLAPLRLSQLGAGGLAIAGTFFVAGAAEMPLSPLMGRLAGRRGNAAPGRLLLAAAAVVGITFPQVGGWFAAAAVLAVGLPACGSLCVPGSALLSEGAERLGLHQGVAFGLGSLAWSGGQAAAALTAGAAAQVTSDLVPGAVLAGLCLAAAAALAPGSPLRPGPAAPITELGGEMPAARPGRLQPATSAARSCPGTADRPGPATTADITIRGSPAQPRPVTGIRAAVPSRNWVT